MRQQKLIRRTHVKSDKSVSFFPRRIHVNLTWARRIVCRLTPRTGNESINNLHGMSITSENETCVAS